MKKQNDAVVEQIKAVVEQINTEVTEHSKIAVIEQSNKIVIAVKKLKPGAVVPVLAKKGDVAFDLVAVDFEIQGDVAIIGTGLAFEIPEGYEGQVRSRSGLGMKGIGITHGLGTIDSGYRGEVKVLLSSKGSQQPWLERGAGASITGIKIGNTNIKAGDRVAQLAIREVPQVEFIAVENLSDTERGDTGFGSSGMATKAV